MWTRNECSISQYTNSPKCHFRYRQIVYCVYERFIGLYNELPKDPRKNSFCDTFLLLYKLISDHSLWYRKLSVNNDCSLLPADTLTYQTQLNRRSLVGPGIR